MDAEDQPGERERPAVRRSTLILTNAIKLGGFVMAMREMATTRDPVVLGVCVVMMSGVQGLEDVLVTFLERFFGVGASGR